jgi:hypothetical protein
VNVAALSQGIEAFCQRLQPTLDQLTFAQRRQLVELLIDRVIVNDTQVEIRYVVPTGPKGETTPFCHLRLDYLAVHRRTIEAEYEMILRHRTPKAGANMPQWNESVQWHGEVVNAFFSTMLLF